LVLAGLVRGIGHEHKAELFDSFNKGRNNVLQYGQQRGREMNRTRRFSETKQKTYQETGSADQTHEVVTLGNACRLLDRHRSTTTAINLGLRVNVASKVPNLTQVIAEKNRI
jgi:hypothetical protein